MWCVAVVFYMILSIINITNRERGRLTINTPNNNKTIITHDERKIIIMVRLVVIRYVWIVLNESEILW